MGDNKLANLTIVYEKSRYFTLIDLPSTGATHPTVSAKVTSTGIPSTAPPTKYFTN